MSGSLDRIKERLPLLSSLAVINLGTVYGKETWIEGKLRLRMGQMFTLYGVELLPTDAAVEELHWGDRQLLPLSKPDAALLYSAGQVLDLGTMHPQWGLQIPEEHRRSAMPYMPIRLKIWRDQREGPVHVQLRGLYDPR